MEIRDPIHGPISVSAPELAVIDSQYFQRLRNIKQLGFSELTFPGASHSRFLHSLGAMHLAGLAFDAVFRDAPWLPLDERARFRQTVRLATLCHDLGHPPLSHTSEVLLPTVGALAIPHLAGQDPHAHASHEHYTLKLLLDSGLTEILTRACAAEGILPLHVAALLSDQVQTPTEAFESQGRNLQNILAALASSELDVDRMDYLLRDSYFTGVSYGKFDVDWLIGHLTHYEAPGGQLHLALHDRAIFTFDDFLLSRHHMFLMVYFHKKSVCYDHMLRRFYDEFPDICRASADPEQYLGLDDHSVWRALRSQEHNSAWAEGILRRRPLQLIAESTPSGRQEPIGPLAQRLEAEGVVHLHVTSKGALSKYQPGDSARAIYVRKQPVVGEPYYLPLAQATRLFERYAESVVLERIYVQPELAARVADWLIELRAAERSQLGPTD
jgi:HD superfamily phosphohydrolase